MILNSEPFNCSSLIRRNNEGKIPLLKYILKEDQFSLRLAFSNAIKIYFIIMKRLLNKVGF